MSGEIVNRVEKSGLMTIDLDEIKLPRNIFEIDIKKWLFEGLFLKEKEVEVGCSYFLAGNTKKNGTSRMKSVESWSLEL